VSAHMPGCVYSRSEGRWTYRAAGCAAPDEHSICPDCHGRGWVGAIRDHRKPDGDPVNRLPCRLCDGSGNA
jgi:hypothetical protein